MQLGSVEGVLEDTGTLWRTTADVNRVDGKEVGIEQARAFLTDHLGTEPAGLELVGEGAWSRCYGVRQGKEELVIRFGTYVDDFRNDERASGYAGPDLPIPRVLGIGDAFGGCYAISTRVHGVPLESLGATEWRTIVPGVAGCVRYVL